MTVRILVGDCLERLAGLPFGSAHCCVTSPPYWGLRDYGSAGQIGLEATVPQYVDSIVAVFRHVWNVLRDDGTLWLNLGDSYAASGRGGGGGSLQDADVGTRVSGANQRRAAAEGFKPKDLCGIPWRVALALQADGWYLRSDIIWHKPNPMPESVTDRPTKSHEYLFLFAKSERYYYDAEAIKEIAVAADIGEMDGGAQRRADGSRANDGRNFRLGRSGNRARKPASARGVPVSDNGSTNGAVAGSIPWEGFTRNRRTVWTVPTKPFKGAHFATFPPDLIEPCILAGCPEGGTVLDPFGGAGTTGLVAAHHHRNAILIEINPAYAQMAHDRIVADSPLLADVRVDT